MAIDEGKKRTLALNLTPVRTASSDSSSSSSSLKPPRTPRFAEDTAVHSPAETRKMPFSDRKGEGPQVEVGDLGFGYINEKRESAAMPASPRSLKSAMRYPGSPRTINGNPLSPTFREETILERREELTEKQQAKDLKVKTRVRLAKFALRGVNFSCSLIILAMLSTSFAIFNATKSLPPQNGVPAWASNTNAWPQKLVLAASCVSLAICVFVFVGYCRGGHRRAEKVGVYYTLFAVGWFILSMVMWALAAGILQSSRNNSKNQDVWGWSCVQNHRSDIFRDKVDYALVCRLQNWSLICIIIEIVVEVISITLYSIVFYRYYSKRKLHKTMDMRDKARSDLYLAQLRTQTAPNTPGFGPKSPAFSQYALSPRFPPQAYRSLGDIDETASPFTPGGNRLAEPESAFSKPAEKTSFNLQPAPKKANPATPKGGALITPTSATQPTPNFPTHAPVAPGEMQYEAVPIPGAYADQAVKSPPPTQTSFGVVPPRPARTNSR
ncbi:Hyphal anastamosis-8 protein [Coniochaeta hoffmannii]|uniref:Hyphal anastamosis-8 protein n=1 Tax=Coniochaeta hoffmannii TaxID=91930 RepID=A0AA38SC39_9PEZI|nr:Hyphal anastamosis-8 protein [Coniochaeta hoffmannii]